MKTKMFEHGLEPTEPAPRQQFLVIKNNSAESDVCFSEHVIKPGEELRLPMLPLPQIGWKGTLNDLVQGDPNKTLAAELLRKTWTTTVVHAPEEAPPELVKAFYDNPQPLEPKTYKRIDKIGRF